MFQLIPGPIVPPVPADSSAGGFVTFEGRVRSEHNGRRVVGLEYEAFGALAHSEGRRVVEEAVARFGLLDARCIHRVGRLKIGETAVWIGVTAPHRRDAFEGCEWIIDQLKLRVPIWKRERYAEGDSGWIGSDSVQAEAPVTEDSFYARQIRLSEVGAAGQSRLKSGRVLVIGAGGLGCAAIPYLAGAGVGTLGICDFDEVQASDLHRQVLYGARDVGKPKALLAARVAERVNPFITVRDHAVRLNRETGADLFRQYDVVLDCTDNFPTKFLLNDVAIETGTPLVQSSIYQFEGQIQILDPSASGGCLRCVWPETPPEGCVDSCAESGVLGVVPGVFGALQASETLQLLLGLDRPLRSSMLLVDLRTCTVTHLRRPLNPHCPICGDGVRLPEVDLDPSACDRDLSSCICVDLREDDEARPMPNLGIRTWQHRPLSRVNQWLGDLDRERSYLLVCEHGIRSGHLARRLRTAGWRNVFSLAGGATLALRLQREP